MDPLGLYDSDKLPAKEGSSQEPCGYTHFIERDAVANVGDEGTVPSEESEMGVMSFWDPVTLRFHDSHLETWFSRDRTDSWLENDPSVYICSIVPPALTMFVTWSALDLTLRCSLLATCVSVVLLSHLSTFPSYRSKRWIIVSALRILVAFQSANVALAGLNEGVSSGSLMGRLVFWGPLIPLVWTSISMRLPFHVHFCGQLSAVLVSSLWVHYICTSATAHSSSFGLISFGIDTVMARTFIPFPFPAVGNVSMPCHAVVIFAHVVIGMIIPCFLVYALEIHSRAEFCNKVAGSKYHSRVQTYMWDSLKVGLWTTLFFTHLSWVVFSLNRDNST